MTGHCVKKTPIILDTDPGIDDAVAIAAALFSPELDLQLITTVAGNVSVEKTTRNALQLLHFWQADMPVAQGAATPLTRPLRDAASIHGESGMDGYDFPAHDRQTLNVPAFQAMYERLMASPEPLTLVTIGPLTNIALLLTHYPACTAKINRLVMMGGSAGRGNFTPNAEFNIAIDPEAAARVFESGIEIVMCGLDVTHQAVLTPDYLAALPALNRTGQLLHALFSHYRAGSMTTGLRMHDLCAIAWVLRPELFTLKRCFVAVETRGDYTAGTTVVDIEGRLNRPANAQVALDIDVAAFREWVAQTLARAP
nr:ribonucleoside hydrolase RihC [Cronobacter dublinensis]